MQLAPLMAHTMAEALRNDGDANTLTQAYTLRVLSESPRTFKELVAMRRVSAPTLSRSIEAMVRRGWVERVPHPSDRRQRQLQLTAEGQAEFERLRSRVQQHLARRFDSLDDKARRLLWQSLALLEEILQSEQAGH
ncbi:MAG: MarR family transcriptional regulator [Anaerolineae bacterium]|nr:MarR family transcriptional regulator [Thermoflexales bacterium]MDW8395995.1 MarR family transcriptional regulator [Anaerolineae bacterium]